MAAEQASDPLRQRLELRPRRGTQLQVETDREERRFPTGQAAAQVFYLLVRGSQVIVFWPTAGAVVVLGEAGRNFAAGMTGGVAYALDLDENFKRHCNHELVTIEPVGISDEQELRRLIQRHLELTGSLRARDVLWHWDHYRRLFWKVVTQGVTAAQSSAEPEEIVSTEPMPLVSVSH